MNKVQRLILLIAKEIKRICNKNGISYYIDGGTQIGAVRHHGFIPWDDDFDIVMTRENYEKFIRVCFTDLDKSKFYLQTDDTDQDYCFAFAKIRLNGTRFIEDFARNAHVHNGIFVDIFPLDRLPDNNLVKRCFLVKNHLLKNMIWIKCGYGTDDQKKKFSYKVLKAAGIPFSTSFLKKRRIKLITSFNNQASEYYFYSDYPSYRKKVIWYKDHDDYLFEGESFSGYIARYMHESLTFAYGDYMKIPPKSEQRQHSTYEVDFGPYNK